MRKMAKVALAIIALVTTNVHYAAAQCLANTLSTGGYVLDDGCILGGDKKALKRLMKIRAKVLEEKHIDIRIITLGKVVDTLSFADRKLNELKPISEGADGAMILIYATKPSKTIRMYATSDIEGMLSDELFEEVERRRSKLNIEDIVAAVSKIYLSLDDQNPKNDRRTEATEEKRESARETSKPKSLEGEDSPLKEDKKPLTKVRYDDRIVSFTPFTPNNSTDDSEIDYTSVNTNMPTISKEEAFAIKRDIDRNRKSINPRRLRWGVTCVPLRQSSKTYCKVGALDQTGVAFSDIGLRVGDIIKEVGIMNRKINDISINGFLNYLDVTKGGDTVSIVVERGGKLIDLRGVAP